MEESAGKLVSQLGFAESVTSVAQQPPERFRPKRAAVLICLFEGDSGELRVILTKRSSKLSTHSGSIYLISILFSKYFVVICLILCGYYFYNLCILIGCENYLVSVN